MLINGRGRKKSIKIGFCFHSMFQCSKKGGSCSVWVEARKKLHLPLSCWHFDESCEASSWLTRLECIKTGLPTLGVAIGGSFPGHSMISSLTKLIFLALNSSQRLFETRHESFVEWRIRCPPKTITSRLHKCVRVFWLTRCCSDRFFGC